jgi:hypothetical protein
MAPLRLSSGVRLRYGIIRSSAFVSFNSENIPVQLF